MEEIWKPIVGYENLYEVSNLGRIRSFDRKVYRPVKGTEVRKGKLLKQQKNKSGYYMVTLTSISGERKGHAVHRLVAYAFVPNTLNKEQVDHINTIRTDNRVKNLRWVTHKENMNNPITKEFNTPSNRAVSMLINGVKIKDFISISSASRETGVSRNTIYNSCNNLRKSRINKKFIWKI